jgi:hypothetical protein
MMVFDAPRNIATRLESQEMVGTKNLLIAHEGLVQT